MSRLIQTYFFVLLFTATGRLYAQQENSPTHLFRLYEDDDCINIFGNCTDNAYTNGLRLDYFYTPQRPSSFFLDKLLPRAGDSSIDVYGWGLAQLMYTPDDLGNRNYLPNDYPYSGALFVTHTLASYNVDKKFDWQTAVVLGVIGPAAFARQTQTLVHRVTGFIEPRGWGHQYNNDLLLNVNITGEKQLATLGHTVDVIGGGQAFIGTMLDGLSLYQVIRIGVKNNYFDGFISQYAGAAQNEQGQKRGQFYFFVKPEARLVLHNALLQGGLFTKNPNLDKTPVNSKPLPPYHDINPVVAAITYGAVLTLQHWSISLSQTAASAEMKDLYCHSTGNISLYYGW